MKVRQKRYTRDTRIAAFCHFRISKAALSGKNRKNMTVKNVKLVFDRRHRATPDNPAAVEFAVPMGDGRRRIIPTGVRLCAGQWDAEASRVQFHPDAAALNRRLLAALQAANAQIVAHLTLYGELTDAAVDQIFGIERPERRRPASFVAWCREQNDITSSAASAPSTTSRPPASRPLTTTSDEQATAPTTP